METLANKLLEVFSLEYMFSVIMCSYLIIKGIDCINGCKQVPTWQKRMVTFIVGVIMFWVFKTYTSTTVDCLMASYFAAVFVYDTAIKWIIGKLGASYFKEETDKC